MLQGGVVDNIYLNEACSSGCGSFLQTFANALRYDMEDVFASWVSMLPVRWISAPAARYL